MAFQAAKLLFMVGAGVATTIIASNGRFSDFVSDFSKVVSKHMREDTDSKSDKNFELMEQIKKMTQELRYMSASKEITIVNESGSTAGSVVNWWPVLVVGATGYGYLRWKGIAVSSLMYVTKHQMSEAVSGVSRQFDQVSGAVATARRYLSSRIDNVNKTLEENTETAKIIQNDVLAIKDDVSNCGNDVQVVQMMVKNLEVKISQVHMNQEFAKQGIRYLCDRVSGLRPKAPTPELPVRAPTPELPVRAPTPKLPAEKEPLPLPAPSSSSSPSFTDVLSGGLKEIAEKLELEPVDSTPARQWTFDFKRWLPLS